MSDKLNQALADSIQVIDDALPKEMMAQLAPFYEGGYWDYEWKTPNSDFLCWGSLFAGVGKASAIKVIEGQADNSEEARVLRSIWQYIQQTYLPNQDLLRISGAAFTYGSDGYIHSDNDHLEYLSILIYIHPEWKAEWGGHIAYYNLERTEILKVIAPMSGRMIIAPGFIPHRPFAPGRDVQQLRACINYRSRTRET
jgi:SM-20-related protein